jgi:Nrap protein PAP/OAS-like domain
VHRDSCVCTLPRVCDGCWCVCIFFDFFFDSQLHSLCVLSSLTLSPHLGYDAALLLSLCSLAEAIVLLKSWLWRRGLDRSVDSLNGFLLSMIAVHVHYADRLFSSMTAYQIFKVVITFLSQEEWIKSVNFLTPFAADDQHTPSGWCSHSRAYFCLQAVLSSLFFFLVLPPSFVSLFGCVCVCVCVWRGSECVCLHVCCVCCVCCVLCVCVAVSFSAFFTPSHSCSPHSTVL